jgi:hypothetical protein
MAHDRFIGKTSAFDGLRNLSQAGEERGVYIFTFRIPVSVPTMFLSITLEL